MFSGYLPHFRNPSALVPRYRLFRAYRFPYRMWWWPRCSPVMVPSKIHFRCIPEYRYFPLRPAPRQLLWSYRPVSAVPRMWRSAGWLCCCRKAQGTWKCWLRRWCTPAHLLHWLRWLPLRYRPLCWWCRSGCLPALSSSWSCQDWFLQWSGHWAVCSEAGSALISVHRWWSRRGRSSGFSPGCLLRRWRPGAALHWLLRAGWISLYFCDIPVL